MTREVETWLSDSRVVTILIINRFVWRHKIVTSETLGARQRVSEQRKKRKPRSKRSVFSLDLKTATEKELLSYRLKT